MTDINVKGLKDFADWHVSCNGGNISPEAADAYAVLDLLTAAQARIAALETAEAEMRERAAYEVAELFEHSAAERDWRDGEKQAARIAAAIRSLPRTTEQTP